MQHKNFVPTIKHARDLSLQKRLAMSILDCGHKKAWLDPTKAQEIMKARTRGEVRALIREGVIRHKVSLFGEGLPRDKLLDRRARLRAARKVLLKMEEQQQRNAAAKAASEQMAAEQAQQRTNPNQDQQTTTVNKEQERA